MPSRWSINGRFLSQEVTGVQRYAQEVVQALDAALADEPAVASKFEVELLVPQGARRAMALKAIATRTVGRLEGHAWEQMSLPAQVSGGLLSLCNAGPLAVDKQILCIHDMNIRNWPLSYSLPFRTLYRVLLPALGRRVHRVATVSQYSAGEIIRHGVCGPEKLFVAPNGHEHVARWQPEYSETLRQAIGADTVAILGSPAPHKNVNLIIGMADRLSSIGLRIAVAGMSDERVFKGGSARTHSPNVVWLGQLGDGELATLLGSCLCLAFPSFEEGFGLPPLEAMAIGCPVVASDRASMPEICGDAALYAAPDDPGAWLDQFRQLQTSPALRDEMAVKGKARAACFRWKATAALYLKAMAEADRHADNGFPKERASAPMASE